MIFDNSCDLNEYVSKRQRTSLLIRDNKLHEFIGESLSSFSLQRELASVVYNLARGMFNKNVYDSFFKLSKKYNISGIGIHIIKNSKTISMFNHDAANNYIYIAIGDYNFIDNSAVSLRGKIAHELMHGYSLNNIGSNDVIGTSTPDYYDAIIDAFIQDPKYNNSYIFAFAYALYSCCDQEVSAFTSQVNVDIYDSFIKNKLNRTHERFVQIVNDDCAVRIYRNNISNLHKIMRLSDEDLRALIIDPIIDHNIPTLNRYSEFSIRSLCKKLQHISEDALRKCYKNAMIAYEELSIDR